MSDAQIALSDYIAGFRRKLAACRTAADCRPLWTAEEAARTALCIVPASYTYARLNEEWVARGKELVEAEKQHVVHQ